MEVSKEFEMSIANDNVAIKSIDVVYKNGETVSGLVSKAKFLPFQLTICKHETLKGEDPYKYLEFNQISSVALVYHNGEIKNFN